VSGSPAPALSVILPALAGVASLRLTLAHLRRQTLRAEIEVVVVGGAREEPTPDDSLDDLWGLQWVAVSPTATAAEAYAAGVRKARAEVVALGEDHAFPEPEWAEALLDRHREPWAVVGPTIINANPATGISWADFVIGYGPWMAPGTEGPADFLPGHNSSYKRHVLLGLGEGLEQALAAEAVLHMDLARQGCGLYLEPRARTAHVNFSLVGSWLRVQVANGRVFAATRARRWTLLRRLAFSAASPLIPAVRLARCARQMFAKERERPPLARTVPFLVLGLCLDGFGQLLGTLLGPGSAPRRLAALEADRLAHVTDADRRSLEASA